MGALMALGFAKPLLEAMLERARENGTRVEAELLRSGSVREEAYYGAMARLLRLPFVDHIEPAGVQEAQTLDSQLLRPTMVRILHRHRAPQNAVVPEAARLAELAASLATLPLLGRDLVITTPSAIRRAVWQAGAMRRVRDTTHGLFERRPHLSARIVLQGQQGFVVGMLGTLLTVSLCLAPTATLIFLHVLLSSLYLLSTLLRSYALRRRRAAQRVVVAPEPRGPLPRYTVMVALYREAAVAEQLIKSLERLDWPRSLLDIKLVCEADDRDTIEALRARLPGPHFEIVEVPDYGPRTKPKALTYALAGARGDYLAIYDAEDRPHPAQLREAYHRFAASDPQVACLQAPLIITNAKDSWISALFSLEYSALFRGLLPMLGKAHLPLPLGGTSNHFRTAILKASGGWDPYNVTEDADLGLRLYRMGYRSDVLRCQTLEDAPTALRVWMGQRSRWFKGWLQTWLVLMRRPRMLVGEMGLGPFLIIQLMIAGMLISALLHPLIYLFLGLGMAALLRPPAEGLPNTTLVLFTVDFFNIFGSYLLLLALGLTRMTEHERRLVGRRWGAVPLYWMATSVAAWRAVIELKTKPFFWNKTPHAPSPANAAPREPLPVPNVQ
jgi:cellulose synthase/poly-beta-1,6-N-acetylglucosamine synthase-like glycosyltransferase